VTTEPTLAEDEARLARIAADLEAGLDAALPGWLRQTSKTLCPTVEPEALENAIAETMAEFSPRLSAVLHADVDAGAGNPLAVVRSSTARVTALLQAAGARPAARDEFDARAFPDDVFGFGPSAFADIDASLHEVGLVWGAARAHVHLRRRREQST